MLSQQPTISTTTNHNSLVDRVLHLRRQLGIDLSLSLRNSEDMPLSLKEHQASFIETPQHASPAYGSQGWLTWSQSPCEGSLPEKGQEELRRCP